MSSSLQAGGAAEAMDNIYRYQRYIYDASRAFYLLGRDELIARLNVPTKGSVLEVGCGTGRNLIKVAEAYPEAQCCGLDVSRAMLATASRSIASHGLGARITCEQADATSFDPQELFGRGTFDRVFISYSLSMIPAWREVLPNAIRCLGDGSMLHIVDFGTFEEYPALFRRLQMAWLARFGVTPIPSFAAELSAIANEHGCKMTIEALYRGYCLLAQLRRG